MTLELIEKSNKNKTLFREEEEAKHLLNVLFEHDEEGRGAFSTLALGMPGACKTAVDLLFADYAMTHYQNDKVFWRSSMNSPLQFFKLKNWRIYVEKDSGVNFFDRITGCNITESLSITYFNSFDELYDKCKPGICNAVFFKDLHMKGIDKDSGNLQWFRFIRFLLGKYEWKHVILDEYHEMVKSGSGGKLWHEIREHSDDVSNARKSNLSLHGNAHQTQEIDSRVIANIMCVIQMYGSRPYKHSPIVKKAIGNIPQPTEKRGAGAWISIGGKFGRFNASEVYKLPPEKSIMAKILPNMEKTKCCAFCDRVFLVSDSFMEDYCSKSCYFVRKARKDGGRTDETALYTPQGCIANTI